MYYQRNSLDDEDIKPAQDQEETRKNIETFFGIRT